MDELSVKLSKLNIGCNAISVHVNHLFYADGSVLLVPSARALQQITDIHFKNRNDYELKYKLIKTEYMCAKPKWFKQLKMPDIFMGIQTLPLPETKKYRKGRHEYTATGKIPKVREDRPLLTLSELRGASTAKPLPHPW